MRRQVLSDIPDFHDPDCFHDGFKVLDCITQVHNELLQNKRMDDWVTEEILDLINDMLSPKDVRLKARQVWDRAQRYLNPRGSMILSPKYSLHDSPVPANEIHTRPTGSSRPEHGFPATYSGHQQRQSSGNISQATTQAIPPLSTLIHWQSPKVEPENSVQARMSPVTTTLHHNHSPRSPKMGGFNITIPANPSVLEPGTPIQESPKDMTQEEVRAPPSLSPRHNLFQRATSERVTPQTGSPEQMSSLSVISALNWMLERKSSILTHWKNVPPGGRGDLMKQLDERDHVSLIVK